MKCPKCQAEMEAGFLQTDMRNDIAWVNKLRPFGLGYWSKDAIIVSSDLNVGLTAVPTHICKRCKLLLGDYSHMD